MEMWKCKAAAAGRPPPPAHFIFKITALPRSRVFHGRVGPHVECQNAPGRPGYADGA